jgi:hypothetical protein
MLDPGFVVLAPWKLGFVLTGRIEPLFTADRVISRSLREALEDLLEEPVLFGVKKRSNLLGVTEGMPLGFLDGGGELVFWLTEVLLGLGEERIALGSMAEVVEKEEEPRGAISGGELRGVGHDQGRASEQVQESYGGFVRELINVRNPETQMEAIRVL